MTAKRAGSAGRKRPPQGAAARRAGTKKKGTAARRRRSVLQLVKESWFYRIYFGALALCALGLILGLSVLSGVMREYEETRPIHSAEPVLALFEQHDWARLRELDASAAQLKYDAPEQYAAQLEALTQGGEFTLRNIVTISEDEQQYNILMDGQKIGEMILEKSGEKTKHGFERWRLKSVTTQAFVMKEYTITVPSDSSVTVNGQALTEADVKERDIPAVDSANLPEGVNVPTLTRYGVQMLDGGPEDIVVTDRNGAAQTLVQEGENSYSCGLSWDDAALKERCEADVVKWGRRLAAYTSNDYSKIDLSNACADPSPARSYIRNMENQWAQDHEGYKFKDIETGEYFIYSNDCFSCRMRFDYVLQYAQGERSYPTQYTLYFVRGGGGFKLYSFTIDAASEGEESA